MEELYTHLFAKATHTRNSRLEAYRRSNKLQALSTYSISGISALTIASSLYLAVVPKDELKDFVGLIGAIASLFILIISLIDASKDYSLKAYLYHRCALDLSPICLLLEKHIKTNNFNVNDFDVIADKYQNILDNYVLNHSNDDYRLYTWKYRKEFHNDVRPIFAQLVIFFIDLKTYIMYYLMIVFMVFAAIMLIIRLYK